MKYFVNTFGCQMNMADSEEMGRHLAERGFTQTTAASDADWILVNTCTVRQHAENRAASYLGRLRPWREKHPHRRLIVTGCAAQRLQKKLRTKFSHVDLVVGARDIDLFPKKIDSLLAGPEERNLARSTGIPADSKTTGFVTIMRGCNYACSYCIVPSVRGREISRAPREILDEIRLKASRGIREFMLLGQTVNSYRFTESRGAVTDFAELLRAIDREPGVERLRFMSPHPSHVTDRMIRAMAECRTVCEHLHLPVQSGSDAVLKRMRRGYTSRSIIELTDRLRKAIPSLSITTDVLVGFPGETEEDFEETLRLLDAMGLDGAYCFKYSARPGTPAAEENDPVPAETIEDRHARVLKHAEELALGKRTALVGTDQQVSIDAVDDSFYEGRTRSHWKVRWPATVAGEPGSFMNVRITGFNNLTLRGEPCMRNS
ncbi:MAG TPA: tRNA (N6-isopentenyl adenosine(37)-C2)-methylthiotransferase MiaB [Elusimicrobiota bacterium]|nr:tRNA (N6-isopentenyl adenosine(37)-C2)-methylthiotransferase MiaB [Elusimicrobiota bacterium]